jgi:hypothetical protein
MTIHWATNLLQLHLNKLFKKLFVIWHYFLATVLATFQKIGQFFPNHLVTLLRTEVVFYHSAGAFGGPCVLLARTYNFFTAVINTIS